MVETKSTQPAKRRFAGRSRSVLALGGIAAAASVTLSGCGGTPDFQDAQFTSVSECVKAGFPDNLCQSSYSSALQEYQGTAPKFNSLKGCEQEWGSQQCVPGAPAAGSGTSASSIFVPALAGFVLSQALQRRYSEDGGAGLGYYGGYYGGYRGSPIYRDRGGATVTVDRTGGRSISKPVNVNTTTVSRSGFGGMGKSGGMSFGG